MMDLRRALRRSFRVEKGRDNMPTLVSDRDKIDGRHGLAKAMGALEFKTGIEIGTRLGSSAKIWCEAMPGLRLTCVDPYIGYLDHKQERQDRNYEKAKLKLSPYDVTILRMTSEEAAGQFEDGSVDFVNIDGDHTFDVCMMDIIKYVPKVREGGLVLIHDYYNFRMAGVTKAVDAYTHCHRIDPWYVTRDVEPTVFWQRGAERL